MAITYIGGSQEEGSNSTFIGGVGSGDTLLMAIFDGIGGSGVTDSSGDIWHHVSSADSSDPSFGGLSVQIWYATNVAAGGHTVTYTGGTVFAIDLLDFAGVDIVSPVYGGNHINNQGGTGSVGPDLTNIGVNDWLVTSFRTGGTETVNPPWTNAFNAVATSYYAPGTTGTFHATLSFANNYCASGVILAAPIPPLTLTLSDAISTSDFLIDSFATTVTDSTTVTDTSPNSFSVQSDSILPINVPVVESLVNQLIPVVVKRYFRVQE